MKDNLSATCFKNLSCGIIRLHLRQNSSIHIKYLLYNTGGTTCFTKFICRKKQDSFRSAHTWNNHKRFHAAISVSLFQTMQSNTIQKISNYNTKSPNVLSLSQIQA